MDTKINKQTVLSSLLWKFLERGGNQIIQFSVQILLARLLAPKDFGLISIVTVFISLANVFVQSGFSTALIQKKDADNIDFSTVFYISLLISFVLYTLLFATAPIIASFYSYPTLTIILRILGLNLFSGALNSVQNSFIAKNMLFRIQFLSSTVAGIISGIVGIGLAITGYGVWALVFQQLVNQFSVSIILWFTLKWRPILQFSFKRLKRLFSFGSNILLSSLVVTIYNNLRTLFIGRFYPADVLGYYNRGMTIPQVLTHGIDDAVKVVMFPTYSQYQDNRTVLKSVVKKSISASSFVIFPMMIGLAVIAEPLVVLLLTDTWLPAVPFIQIFSVTYMFLPINSANIQSISAIGRSDIYLKLEVYKKVFGIIILVISIPYGVKAIAISSLISTIISTILNAYPNKHFLSYNFSEQILDLLPALLLSAFMGIVVYIIGFTSIIGWLKLPIQVSVGIIVYFILAKFFKVPIYEYIVITIKTFFKK